MNTGESNPPPVPTGKYYILDSRKVTYREYWNVARSPLVLIPWIAKLLRISLKMGSGFQHFDSVRELEVAENNFPAKAHAKLQPLIEKVMTLGFEAPRFYSYANLHGETRTSFVAFFHRSSATTLRLMYSCSNNANILVERVTVVLLSELSDGTFFFTSDNPAQFLSGAGIIGNRLVGASPDRLFASHRQKLAEWQANNPARPVESVEVVDRIWDRYEKESMDFGLQRGIYRAMSAEELQTDQKILSDARAVAPDNHEDAAVLMEITKLQNKKTGWRGALLLLIVSMVFFLGAGSRQWSWSYVLILVPLLFVHELGHYVAMRAFNYRNVRMFFIPFFGAAVAGQHLNVAGWKKVVVSLAGPVPSIFLGVFVGFIGVMLPNALLIKIAVVTLILNGFNLLPVLPLDGGWVFHTLLFSRHYLLDTAFRALAAVALILGGIFGGTRVLMFLGGFMAIGIPTIYRMARLTANLRQRGLPPALPDAQDIPGETARVIIGEVRKNLPNMRTNKVVAEQTLQIFETLNARPPGWAASVGLLFAHLISLGIAVVFTAFFVIDQHGGVGQWRARAAKASHRTLKCESMLLWQGADAIKAPTQSGITIIATFPRQNTLEEMFQQATNKLPATATLRTFGDSLLLTLPPDSDSVRKEWYDAFQAETKDVFVDHTNFHAIVSVFCTAPNAETAESISDELDGYFGLHNTTLIPPWLPHDTRSAEERARHNLSRQTFQKLQEAQFVGFLDPEVRVLQKKISSAQRRGDTVELKTLRDELEQLMSRLRQRDLEAVRNGKEGPVDVQFADLFIQQHTGEHKTDFEERTLSPEMAQLMGQFPVSNGDVSPADSRYSASTGMVKRRKLELDISWVYFERAGDGAPALVEWLCRKGCTDFKYEIQGRRWDGPEEE